LTSIQQQHAEFERQKNIKGIRYTSVITAAVLFILDLSGDLPQPPPRQ